jgi:hypothetical protein
MQKYKMVIGGNYIGPASGKWFDRYNPYTGALRSRNAEPER